MASRRLNPLNAKYELCHLDTVLFETLLLYEQSSDERSVLLAQGTTN